jgi:hypothetical protein
LVHGGVWNLFYTKSDMLPNVTDETGYDFAMSPTSRCLTLWRHRENGVYSCGVFGVEAKHGNCRIFPFVYRETTPFLPAAPAVRAALETASPTIEKMKSL